MKKSTKAALAGLAFLAGCEIGIAIQLMKMVHNFTIRENAIDGSIPDDEMEALIDEAAMDDGDSGEQMPVTEGNTEDEED